MAIYKDLLGHSLEKFGAVTVFDATFYDSKDKPLITFDSLTVSNISVESEQKEIRGGQGANLLVSYDYAKSATVEITDALASMFSLQYIMGSKLEEDFHAMVRREASWDSGTIWNLPYPAATTHDATVLLIKASDGSQKQIDDVSLTANAETISVAGSVEGDRVIVYYNAKFTGSGESHVKELTLTSTDFPPIVKMVGETIFIDQKTGRRIAAQIEIPKFKLNTNFELTFEAEGDASTFDFSGVALADGKRLIVTRTLGYIDGDLGDFSGSGEKDTGSNPEV